MRPLPSAPATARLGALALGSLICLALAATTARAQAGGGGAPAPLARLVPADGLTFYAELEGLDAHTSPWRKSAAYRLLNETTLGVLLEDLAAQGFDRAAGQGGAANAASRLDGRKAVAALEQVCRAGFAIASHGKPPEKGRMMVVVRGGSRPEVRALLDRLFDSQTGPKARRQTVRKGSRTITTASGAEGDGAIWDEKGDTVLCATARLDAVLATIDGRKPSMAKHPIRAELAKREGEFEPIGFAFLDVAGMGPVPAEAAQMGLDSLKRIDYRWGFQDDALMGIVRLVAPAPRRGMLALFDQPTFNLSSLPLLPAGLNGFTAASVDFGKTYDRVAGLANADPKDAKTFADRAEAVRRSTGLDLRRDVFAHLGPKVAFYSRPPAGQPPLFGLILTVQIDDAAAVAKALPPLMQALNRSLAAPNPNAPQARRAPAPEFLEAEGPLPSYVMTFPPGVQPPPLFTVLQPTIMVGKDRLAIASRRETAQSALAEPGPQTRRWAPTGAFATMAKRLPADLVVLNVTDPRQTLPNVIANLPALIQQIEGGIAQARARAAAQQGQAPPPAGAAPAFQVDPAKVPSTDAVAQRLFPGSIAVTVDTRGVRVVTREAVPAISSPRTAGVMVGLLLPAVQAAREAARRSQCVNNLKAIGVGLHNYEVAEHSYPKAAVTNAQGKPLLSWRVALLPYLGQKDLYAKFKLDEPWDGPHNRALLQSMPDVYACPSAKRSEPGTTNYRAFLGAGTLLDATRGTKLPEVTDGAAFTLAVVEAKEGVPWTKPEELPFTGQPTAPLFGAGSPHPGGFNALFADGTVKFLKSTIPIQVLRALITRAGGEAIAPDSF